jgi:hypothetical protein
MIPADKLTVIAEGIVEKYVKTRTGVHVDDGLLSCTRDDLVRFVEIVLACGAAHEAHQRKHGQ